MIVLWEDLVEDADVIKILYKPVDQNWQEPIVFSSDGAVNHNPSVQYDGAGNFIVIWQQKKRARDVIFGSAFSTENQTWTDPQPLSSPSESCFNYNYTFSSPGKGYITWTMSSNGFDRVIQTAELSH